MYHTFKALTRWFKSEKQLKMDTVYSACFRFYLQKSGSDETAFWFSSKDRVRINPLYLTPTAIFIPARWSQILNEHIIARKTVEIRFVHTLQKIKWRHKIWLVQGQMLESGNTITQNYKIHLTQDCSNKRMLGTYSTNVHFYKKLLIYNSFSFIHVIFEVATIKNQIHNK